MFLDKAAKSFELLLGEAKVTSEVEIIAYYDDEIQERRPPIVSDLVSNGVAAVTIVPAPKDNTKRTVREITIFNADTVQHAVTVRMKDGGNFYRAFAHTMLPGATYQYTQEHGWFDPSVASFYAPLISPAFVGTPTAPTAARGTVTTQIATTEFVNKPYGVFCCTLRTPQNLVTGTVTKVLFDTIIVDTEGMWDALNHRCVIPKAGLWQISTKLLLSGTLTSGSAAQGILSKNGTFSGSQYVVLSYQSIVSTTAQEHDVIITPVILPLIAGDTIELDAVASGTSPVIDASATRDYNILNLRWISP